MIGKDGIQDGYDGDASGHLKDALENTLSIFEVALQIIDRILLHLLVLLYDRNIVVLTGEVRSELNIVTEIK